MFWSFIFLALVLFLALQVVTAQEENDHVVYSESFDDNTVPLEWVNSGCSFEQRRLECNGNNNFAWLNISETDWNTSKYWNMTFYFVTTPVGGRGAVVFQNTTPILQSENSIWAPRYRIDSLFYSRFGLYFHDTNKVYRILPNVSSLANQLFYEGGVSYIHNSTGYYIFNLGNLTFASIGNETQEKMEYLGVGDWENDQNGVAIVIDSLVVWEMGNVTVSDEEKILNNTNTLINFQEEVNMNLFLIALVILDVSILYLTFQFSFRHWVSGIGMTLFGLGLDWVLFTMLLEQIPELPTSGAYTMFLSSFSGLGIVLLSFLVSLRLLLLIDIAWGVRT